jgi:cell division protein FtsL
MLRLNLVLLTAVVVSAMYLVQVQYQSRRLFVEVEKAQSLSRKLETERERVEVDKRSSATPLRVEKIAKEQLQMRTATPAVTQYVKLPAAEAPVPGAKP